MENTPEAAPSAKVRRLGAVLWFRWIRERYDSVYAYATARGLDRSVLRRQLTGERSYSLPVATALEIQAETNGAVPAESWGKDSDRPVVASLDDLEAEIAATTPAEGA